MMQAVQQPCVSRNKVPSPVCPLEKKWKRRGLIAGADQAQMAAAAVFPNMYYRVLKNLPQVLQNRVSGDI